MEDASTGNTRLIRLDSCTVILIYVIPDKEFVERKKLSLLKTDIRKKLK